MDKVLEDISKEYTIPCILHSSFSIYTRVVLSFLLIFIWGLIFLPTDNLQKIFFGIIGSLLLVLWLNIDFYKKLYLKLTESELIFKSILGSKSVAWRNIYEYGILSGGKSGNFLQIKSRVAVKRTGIVSLQKYSIRIPLDTFSKIDFVKLTNSISNKIHKS